jgi:hypothetical protein
MNASETLNPPIRGWWAWAGTRLRRPPPIGHGLMQILLQLCIVWLGLAGWCAIANRATPVIPTVMMPFGFNESWNDVGGIFVAPALYIAAWQAVSFGSLQRALWGGLIGTGMCLAGFILTGIVTLLAFPVALPFGLACAGAIAKWLAWQDERDAGEDGGAGQAAHIVGLSIALLGLPFAWLRVYGQFSIDSLPRGNDLWDFVAALLPITLLCLPHAVLTWLLRRPLHPPAPLIRTVGFLLPLWALPAWFLGTAWPATLHTENATQRAAYRAEFRRFQDSGLFGFGLHAGQRITVAAPSREVTLVVPEGWLGLHDRHGQTGAPLHTVRLGRDAAAPQSAHIVSQLLISRREPGAETVPRCPHDTACTMRLPLPHELEATIFMRAGLGHRWREARAEAAEVLRAAGFAVLDEPGL